jgi:hypothetical protein
VLSQGTEVWCAIGATGKRAQVNHGTLNKLARSFGIEKDCGFFQQDVATANRDNDFDHFLT